MILDTEFIIALANGDPDAKALATELESSAVPLRVPTVVLRELYVGVGAGDSAFENARKYDSLVANKPVVELTENIAKQAGALQGRHYASDSKPRLGPGDAVIAATALQYNEPVVTSDGDLEHVDGLAVESI